jgi:5-(carboxyamino)imidazole ribonucleotide synthase
VPFTGEVSLIAVRARDGETRFYPLVHNTHDSGILKLSVASTDHPLQALAEDYVQPRAQAAGLRRRDGVRVL